jgi:deoxyribonuclease-4
LRGASRPGEKVFIARDASVKAPAGKFEGRKEVRAVRLGCHISIRRGYSGAARAALALGAGAFQYFPKNPRSLQPKALDAATAADAADCKAISARYGLLSIAHAPYPANIAVDDEGMRRAVAASLRNDLAIAEACGSVGLVVHFGKYRGKDALQGYKNSIQCLNDVLSGWDGQALVLIENQAGEGTDMGLTLDECVTLRRLARHPDKIGFCLDTCHLFAGGVWNGRNWREVARRGEELGYFAFLKAVHLNDSRYSSGSRRDRHAVFGEGLIGTEAFQELLASPWLKDVPLILETPPGPDGTHRAEMARIRELAARTRSAKAEADAPPT